jgi:menaquinone-specific isochorismate synthase
VSLARRVTDARLVTTTVPLDADVDLVDVAGDAGVLWEQADGVSLAGRGVAARLAVCLDESSTTAGVVAALGAIECDGLSPPVAVGALPFVRSESAEMVIPAVVVRRQADGSCWLTVTGSDPAPALEEIRRNVTDPRPDRGGPAPREYRVRSTMAPEAWCGLVGDAAKAVAGGELTKVVLAREVTIMADRPLRSSAVARRLRSSYPSCMVFSVGGFVGASPELLVDRRGALVRSRPLAGTAARSGSSGGDAELVDRLLSSAKEREEHRVVVDAVSDALAPYCEHLAVPRAPAVIAFGTLAHLGTAIVGRLRSPLPTALDLVAAIHPSPAVGGTPTAAALDYIAAVEGLDRGCYGGPVGWVDAQGDGCWAVGIRAARLEGRKARLIAGGGVVAGSDPEAELAETELKFEPMLAAIIRP